MSGVSVIQQQRTIPSTSSPVHNSFSRIDYFYVDKNLLPSVTGCEYQPIVISDHCPLTMTMRIPGAAPGNRLWRLNPLLLSDDSFVTFIKSEIEFFLTHNQTPEFHTP